jgi:SAM-dependent methyltransferase
MSDGCAGDWYREYFPEIAAGGYTRLDGSVEFYSRVNAIISPGFHVLDFGAGRGAWRELGAMSRYRRDLQRLKGKVKVVVGCDVDEAILENESLDERCVLPLDFRQLPFENGRFDMVVADFVFEHVQDPEVVCKELTRVVKGGGWICARTPNKWGYISMATRLIPNRWHEDVLRRSQPGRLAHDEFPTAFKLNTRHDISRYFPASEFEDCSYPWTAEPSYYFGSRRFFGFFRRVDSLLPAFLANSLFVFLRKR